MRLTDEPHTLSAMKPDIAWPEDLQAVMNKALARNAGERYATASQFAHDLVQAIDRMPVTSITAMGTEMIRRMSAGSVNAAAAAATAATVQVNVPKTRIAAKDEAPVTRKSAAAPPAPTPTKSKTGLYASLGGGALLVAAIALFVLKGKSADNPPTANPGAQVPTDSQQPQTQFNGAIDDPRTTDSVLAKLDTLVMDARTDIDSTLARQKMESVRGRVSTADQRVLLAIIEANLAPATSFCVPLKKIDSADVRSARPKTAEQFGILLRDCPK